MAGCSVYWKYRLAQDQAAADHAATLQQHASSSAGELLATATAQGRAGRGQRGAGRLPAPTREPLADGQ